ncbi:hypothetical protein AN993_16520 [Stenotrophomonas maltophilia]|nr:hypothetical protein AN993_16520 [Stenotrophomonas maltophilia]MBA0245250.1 hypothetical protein [Stenotrophomonas maltophilia]MBA0248713.1 hypothetical protein [Stenotrophomonas maltophilia]MBA0308466.1 hypothetical protein [Stenotrophomonas maltophilia]MBA0440883.1 hypothetical protein [Stenotrophomonas maltophilia]
MVASTNREISSMMMHSFQTIRLEFSRINTLLIEAEQWPTVAKIFRAGDVRGTASEEKCAVHGFSDAPPSVSKSAYVNTLVWFQAADAENARKAQRLLDDEP